LQKRLGNGLGEKLSKQGKPGKKGIGEGQRVRYLPEEGRSKLNHKRKTGGTERWANGKGKGVGWPRKAEPFCGEWVNLKKQGKRCGGKHTVLDGRR